MSYQQMPSPEGYREQTNMTSGYHESWHRADMLKISPQEQHGKPSSGQRLALAIVSLFFLLITFLVVIQIAFTSSRFIMNSTIISPHRICFLCSSPSFCFSLSQLLSSICSFCLARSQVDCFHVVQLQT